MSDARELLSDPVFQLNVLLWSLMELPAESEIDPILKHAGYYLTAVGRRLLVPSDEATAAALRALTASPDRSPSNPDLWLRHESEEVHPVVELKAHGFSASSSDARQALKMLASASDLAPSIAAAEPVSGHIVFATVDDDAVPLTQTLDELAEDLVAAEATAAPTGVIGFTSIGAGIGLMSPDPSRLPVPLAEALAEPSTVLLPAGVGEDLRPLYFIPWTPGSSGGRDPGLEQDGLRELTARLFVQAISVIGAAHAPTNLTLSGSELLDGATFGVFRWWRDGDRQAFAHRAAQVIERALRALPGVALLGERIEVDLRDEASKEEVINRLERADPSDPARSLGPAAEGFQGSFETLRSEVQDSA